MSDHDRIPWDEHRDAVLTKLWTDGASPDLICTRLSISKDALKNRRRSLGLDSRSKERPGHGGVWTDPMVERASTMWKAGHSASEIGRSLKVSRNAVIGKMSRLGFDASRQAPAAPALRTTPSAPKGRTPRAAPKPPKPGPQNKPGAVFGAVAVVGAAEAAARRSQQQTEGLAKLNAFSEEPGEKSLPLLDRRFAQCSWPVGSGPVPLCCGDRVASLFRATPTYCERHSRMAVSKSQPVRKISTEPSPMRRAA